ncbi:MAG: hypothetical protein KIT16_00905 [Rhodospirillaceae bacterium]|nr:hypothetical protein [Rhodospirillaceae bacterium]
MPILIGAATAPLAASSPSARAADGAARSHLAAILAQVDAGETAAEGSALAQFLDWAAAWLVRQRIDKPLFYPLPPAQGRDRGATLAGLLAQRLGAPEAARPPPRWLVSVAPTIEGATDPEVLRQGLALEDRPPPGEPVIVGDVLSSESLLRAAALAMNAAGVKPMFALFAAREVVAPEPDPLAPADRPFNVRP